MYDETHEGGVTTRDILLRGLRFGVGLKECIVGKHIAGDLVSQWSQLNKLQSLYMMH